MTTHGRGAWPVNYEPGMWIAAGFDNPDVNARAVHGAIVAIQNALNLYVTKYPALNPDGWYGRLTERSMIEFQRANELQVWGGCGSTTARALLMPGVRAIAKRELRLGTRYTVTGLIYQESLWDPGAVGYLDATDVGLAQINGSAHPDYSDRERLDPGVAAMFVARYVKSALDEFGDVDAAIASYNLGFGGTRKWISEGRPRLFSPVEGARERDVRQYISNVKGAPRR